MKSKALREKRAKLIKDCRVLLDLAEREERELTSEENDRYSRMWADAEALKREITRAESLEEAEEDLAQPHREHEAGRENTGGAAGPGGDARTAEARIAAFERFLRGGARALRSEEARALQVDIDSSGGYITPPEEWVAKLIQKVDDEVFIRSKAEINQVALGADLGVPSLETDPADADWTNELGTGSEDSSMAFGARSLKPQPLAKRIKVANKLIAAPGINAEALVKDRLGYKIGITQEKAFMTGSGANQPLGLFTASANGISTSRDVSTGNTATELRFDGLKEAKYTLKGAYHKRAEWIFHRDGVKQLSKLKDGNGRYIWEDSVKEGEPDRLLGRPVNMSEYAPNTFTTGQYVGIFGDFKLYWIADAMLMQIQRLVELYAETNQVGFIIRLECDGMPVLEEAFVRVKLA